ncbi:MAG: glycogen synthase GlgA [Bacteroidota bacterium]
MSRSLNVLFVSSEVVPFAKTGGLADVAGALPLVVKELGHEVRIAMPLYGSVDQRKFKLHDIARLHGQSIPIGSKAVDFNIKSSSTVDGKSKVQVYFLENEQYFGREGLYVDTTNRNKEYPDNDERFILFSRGTVETLKKLGWQPDIVHCNDWQTALIPAYLKTVYRSDRFFKNMKTVFTVHNLAYQGNFPSSSFQKSGLPADIFNPQGADYGGRFNFLKTGLTFADAITTVSEKYAEEIRTLDDYGHGMNGLLEKRKNDLFGILNGIDYTEWNPEVDSFIRVRYGQNSIDQKQENKKALLERMGLPGKERLPLLGMISRLADQKGFDLLEQSADALMKMPVQLVILGTGEKKYHDLLENLRTKYPNQVGIKLGFSTELAHWIEAGADIFLMPSRYEPCGLNQIYSLKYGTVPVVRATGGLDDTIEDYDPATGTGTGFKFVRYNTGDFLDAIRRAVNLYSNREAWLRLVREGMAKDFSWVVSAKKYIQLYKKLSK